jgi:hypothetical protein
MNLRFFLLPVALLAMLPSSQISTCCGGVITFDDLSDNGDGTNIPNLYQGLSWSNFGVANAVLVHRFAPGCGCYYGMVSASNVAFNNFGFPSEIDSPGTNFNFLSAYLTGVWDSNLDIEIQGFRGINLLYTTTVVVQVTGPTLVNFNWQNISSLTFTSFGGELVVSGGDGREFAMDNFGFEFIPEPSSLLLATLATLFLWPLLKRKRMTFARVGGFESETRVIDIAHRSQ